MLVAITILAFAAFVLGFLAGYVVGQERTARRADRYIEKMHDKLGLLRLLVEKEAK